MNEIKEVYAQVVIINQSVNQLIYFKHTYLKHKTNLDIVN